VYSYIGEKDPKYVSSNGRGSSAKWMWE